MIPDMIHPLGRYWRQPNRDNILIREIIIVEDKMNKVASPCCGSCRYWDYHYKVCSEITKMHGMYVIPISDPAQYTCDGEYYFPRNPIPIVEIPGVKELVEEAYLSGLIQGEKNDIRDSLTSGDLVAEYMKALEDKK